MICYSGKNRVGSFGYAENGETSYLAFTADGGVFDNAKFSLVESTVGEDAEKNDFFENISKVD